MSGTLQDSGSNAIINFPQIPPVTIGTINKNVLPGQVLELPPGMYDTLIVESLGKVKFSAGTIWRSLSAMSLKCLTEPELNLQVQIPILLL